ncbi:MAG TPA: tetratricopeptide repeat protein [Candidatus Brocadiia bacterium]|nr:tetratricopeptide repeat protein [Candidatus Brocadiia bacterium]
MKVVIIIVVLVAVFIGYRLISSDKPITTDNIRAEFTSVAKDAAPGDYAKAEVKFQAGEWKEAIALYESTLAEAKGETRGNCMHRIGDCYRKIFDAGGGRENKQKALEYYEKFLSEFGDSKFAQQVRQRKSALELVN